METLLSYDMLETEIKRIFTNLFDELILIHLPPKPENIHDVINNNASNIMPGIMMHGRKDEFYVEYLFDIIEYEYHFKSGILGSILENLKDLVSKKMLDAFASKKP